MSRNFKVVIVGGGVGGLALALTLKKAGIDYVLLEAKSEIAPQAGASIAVFPSAAKVFDQIGGILDDLYSVCPPLVSAYYRDNKGKPVFTIPLSRYIDRTGYPAGFLPRQELLALMYKHIPDKSKIRAGRKVARIVHSDTGVRVITEGGEEFAGDIVVGADGVHSIVRKEMWDLADKLSPGLITEGEKDTLSAEYCAVAGISTPHPKLEQDSSHFVFNYGRSFIAASGMGGRIFWFLFEKLDKTYRAPNIPKFTPEDGRRLAEKRLEDPLTEDIKFGEVWERTTTYITVPMEEGLFEHWHFGRMMIIGDASHKITINIGRGANSTIETATALTNGLYHALQDHPKGLTTEVLDKVFTGVRAHREISILALDKTAAKSARMKAWVTPILRLMSKYLTAEDYIWELEKDIMCRVEMLDFLPDPDKGAVPMVYSPRHPKERAKFVNGIMYSLPVLALVGYSLCAQNSALIPGEVKGRISQAAAETGILSLGMYSRSWLGLAQLFTTSFSSLSGSLTHDRQLSHSYKVLTLQAILGLFPILTIMVIESYRRGNTLALAKIPVLWGILYQILPVSAVLPLYFFAHAIQIDPSRYYEKNFINIPLPSAKSLIPTLMISFLAPTSIILARETSFKASMALFLPYPVYTSLLHSILRSMFSTPVKVKQNADLPYLRGAYLLSFLVSASSHLYAPLTSSITGNLIPGAPPTSDHGNPFVEAAASIVRFECIIAFAAGLVWVVVLFNDVKRFRKTAESWLALLGYIAAGSAVFGPSASIVAAYAWREELLRV